MLVPTQSWVRRTGPNGLSMIEGGQPGGPAMLLLHGMTDTANTWRPIAQSWLTDRWVVALDLRGHGHSPRFTESDLADDPARVMVNDVVELALELSSEHGRLDLVGQSLGGVLALAAAVESPEPVRSLVLEDPAPAEDDWLPGFKEPFLDEQLRALAAFETEDAALWPPPGDRWSPEEVVLWHEAKPLVDRSLIASGRVTPHGRLANLAEGLQMPTLILLADPSHLDQTLPPIANPLVTVEKVIGAGHCIHRDEPGRFHQLLTDWFQQVSHT